MIVSLRDDHGVGLRDEHKALTRQRVLAAVLDLVADGSIDELSVPAVAARSGVSLATIYRYFPTRADLLAEAAAEPARQALADAPEPQPGDDPLAAFQRAMWTSFAERMPLLRQQLASEPGRQMRAVRTSTSTARLEAYLRARGVDPDSAEGRRLTSLILLLSGSIALVELHDRQGLDVDEALTNSLWAVETLVQATAAAPTARTTRRRTSPRTATTGRRRTTEAR